MKKSQGKREGQYDWQAAADSRPSSGEYATFRPDEHFILWKAREYRRKALDLDPRKPLGFYESLVIARKAYPVEGVHWDWKDQHKGTLDQYATLMGLSPETKAAVRRYEEKQSGTSAEITITEAAGDYDVTLSELSKAAKLPKDSPKYLPTRKDGSNRYVRVDEVKKWLLGYGQRRELHALRRPGGKRKKAIPVDALLCRIKR